MAILTPVKQIAEFRKRVEAMRTKYTDYDEMFGDVWDMFDYLAKLLEQWRQRIP